MPSTASTTSISTPWASVPEFPYALDEEGILIAWAMKRMNAFANELTSRMMWWSQIASMKAFTSTQIPKYTYLPETLTFGGLTIQTDPYLPQTSSTDYKWYVK